MDNGVQAGRNFAPDGMGGGYAGVLPVDGDRGEAALVIRQTVDAARSHLLALRFALFNVAAFACLGAAWAQGWVGTVLSADDTGLSLGIFCVFLAGLGICAQRVLQISIELEQAHARRPDPASRAASFLSSVANRDSGSRAISASQLKLVLSSRNSIVLHIANSLVLLGLVGTVIGFIIALSGVDPQAAGNVDSIAPMVAELIHGMSVALYTTLVGAVLHLWLKVNYLILAGGSVRLLDRLVSRGEEHARV